jgi:hypothetical protein
MSAQDPIFRTLTEAKTSARDQIQAAWQLQVDRVQETLTAGWLQNLERIFDERFADIQNQLQLELTRLETEYRETGRVEAESLEVWKERVAELESSLDSALSDRRAAIDAREDLQKQHEDLVTESAALSAAIAEKDAYLTQTLAEQRTQFAAALEAREAEYQAAVDSKNKELEEALGAKESEFSHRYEQVALRARDSITAAGRSASRELSERVNQAARRLHQAETIEQWRSALLDGAMPFSQVAMVFRVSGRQAVLETSRGVDAGELEVDLQSAPALENAVESKDTVVAVRTSSEFSETIANLIPETMGAKVYLFPIVVQEKVVAILYTEPGEAPLEPSALELLATVAGLALSLRRLANEKAQLELVRIEPAAPPVEDSAKSLVNLMASLSREDQELHGRAQRFARVQVAEMRLYKSNLVKAGRENAALYPALRSDIDSAREAFQNQFLADSTKGMVDYLHIELVTSLASSDESLLGGEYPGPLAPVPAYAITK